MDTITRLTVGLRLPAQTPRHNLGPLLQGFLMDRIDSDYAERLHAGGVNPYSTAVLAQADGSASWVVTALTGEARLRLVEPLRQALDRPDAAVTLRRLGGATLPVAGVEVASIDPMVFSFQLEGPPTPRGDENP